MKQNAPLAIFAFNRPEYLQRTLQALAQNTLASETDVTIFCDGPRNEQDMEKIEEVHAVAQSATGFHTLNIVKRDINMGCANSVITGINTILEEDKHIIVIEDDVWIGAGVKILDGVIIRKGCVIGANTVVNKSTEQYGIYVGAPARLIRKRG